MSDPILTIWSNNQFAETDYATRALLQTGAAAHRVVFAHEGAELAGAVAVAFGQPDPEAALAAPHLRWIHLDSAGYTKYDRAEFRERWAARGAVLTNSSGVYNEPCAQHLLAMITALARQLPAALDEQRGERGWEMSRIRARSRLLNGQTAIIYGFGAIARRLVELLAPTGMHLIGVRRQVKGDESVPVVTESEAGPHLRAADHVINILPANEETGAYFEATLMNSIKPGAIFYNIGRGSTVDQESLLRMLHNGRLRAAYLDVTDPEPLPPDHPLWSAPNCYITPHTGGGHADENERLVRHFLANLQRYTSGGALADRII